VRIEERGRCGKGTQSLFAKGAEQRAVTSRRNLRHGRDQVFRIGIVRGAEHLVGCPDFDDSSASHHRDSRGELRDHGKTVRNENQGEREFSLETSQQFQNLRSDRNIQRRNRLVCDYKLRSQYQSSRDPNSLALASGEFMRKAIQ
jgi:hypothetical protein